MSHLKNYFLFFTSFCFFMVSCYTPRYVYSPSAMNAPALEKKGDSKLSAAYSSNLSGHNIGSNKSRGYDLQGAYAISNHLAIQGDFYHRKEKNGGTFYGSGVDSSTIRYQRALTGVGVGYYTKIDKNKRTIFQIFAGMAFGKFSFTDDGSNSVNTLYHSYFETNARKIYIQPAFILPSKGTFIASFGARLSLLTFDHINTNYTAFDLDNYKLDQIGKGSYIFCEPTMLFTFGNPKVPGLQFEVQAGLSFLQSSNFVDYRSFNSSIALVFDVPKLLAKKKTKASSKQ